MGIIKAVIDKQTNMEASYWIPNNVQQKLLSEQSVVTMQGFKDKDSHDAGHKGFAVVSVNVSAIAAGKNAEEIAKWCCQALVNNEGNPFTGGEIS